MIANISRRSVLSCSLKTPLVAAFLAIAGCSGRSGSIASGAVVCADPNAMDESEQATRKGVGYTEAGSDPTQVCARCAFFHVGEGSSACGTCDVLSGKPVNPHGHCNSWSMKG